MEDNKLSENMKNVGLISGDERLFKPTDRQKELCERLDEFYKFSLNKDDFVPSELFHGAHYSMGLIYRKQNPDWMAQAAHSLREILYPFYRSGAIVKSGKAFKLYGSAGNLDHLGEIIGKYYGFLTDISHHNFSRAATNPIIIEERSNPAFISEEIFENVVAEFEGILFEALRRQIDTHKEIDRYIDKGTHAYELLQELLNFNYDARRYFYSRADESWLNWLWENGFLDVFKEKVEDQKSYSYRSPELDYLAKVVTKVPDRVVEIMLTIPISPQNYNPEVVDRFLWICQSLPAEQLVRIVQKIRDEKWIVLMEKFSHWGFEYKKMIGILTSEKDYSSFLILAEALLEVRTKEDMQKKGTISRHNDPFYFSDLKETEIFEHLVGLEDAQVEPALTLVTQVLGKIICLGEREKNSIFDINDKHLLYDVDFFTIEMGDKHITSYQENVSALAAVTKILIQRSIGFQCSDAYAATLLFETYIESLPNSQAVWRLKLFTISLCPDVFRDELKSAFFKIFDFEKPWLLISGAEYEWALKKGFSSLCTEDREVYVSRVLSFFGDKNREEWEKNSGWCLLSSAIDGLTDKEKEKAHEVFGRELDPLYQPKASKGDFKFGFVSAKAPIDQEALSKMSVPEITKKLKNDWAPKQLRKQDREQDFLHPLNAEGMGNVLKADIRIRLQNYISNASLFFDRDHLDSHYTYSFFMGVFDVLREKKYPANTDWGGLLKLFAEIVDSAKEQEFISGVREREISDTWLVGWDGIHNALADVLLELLKENGNQPIFDFPLYRNALLRILIHLLKYPDPDPVTELKKIDTIERDPQTGVERHTGSDPLTAAINSVRGRAFEVFVHFAEKDGKSLLKNTAPKLSTDVKKLYKNCLKVERTQAVMFFFGRYLPFFYYRDPEWIRGVLSEIFPVETQKNDLYLAAWEGYLSGTLYQELFEELSEYYRRAIILDPSKYTPRKYSTDLDKGIATHLALAFCHFPAFDFDSDLFKLFWKDAKNTERHREFISFIGRSCISRDNAGKWIKTQSIDIEKLKRFWEWALKNCPNQGALVGFSSWIMAERNIFDSIWLGEHVCMTLERTEGNLEWDYGLRHSLANLAKNTPQETLEILNHYLLGNKGLLNRRQWFYVDDEFMGIFMTLYNNPATKEGTYRLIDKLLPIGSGQFWKLKNVIDGE